MKFYDLTQGPAEVAAPYIHRWYDNCTTLAVQGAQSCWSHWNWDFAWQRTPSLPAVPELGTLAMLAAGLVAVLAAVWLRKK